MTFGEKLKEIRKDIGITQKELANKIGVKRTTVAGYETKGKEPSYQTLIKIARALDCSLDYLLGYVEENEEKIKSKNINSDLENFYNRLSERKDLQLLLKETENLNPESIKRIVKIINLIKEEKEA